MTTTRTNTAISNYLQEFASVGGTDFFGKTIAVLESCAGQQHLHLSFQLPASSHTMSPGCSVSTSDTCPPDWVRLLETSMHYFAVEKSVSITTAEPGLPEVLRNLLEDAELAALSLYPLLQADGRRFGVLAIAGTAQPACLETLNQLITVAWSRIYAEAEREYRIAELQHENTYCHKILDSLPAPIFYKDINGTYLGCNRSFEAFLGMPRDRIIGRTVFDVAPYNMAVVCRDADQQLFENPGVQTDEASVQHADGSMHDVLFHKATIERFNGQNTSLVGCMVDISELQQARRRIDYLNNFDLLTGLPNQLLLHDRIEHAMKHNGRVSGRLAVVAIDIDHFQNINHELGHRRADEILALVGERLKDSVRPDDTVARFGGDSFALLLPMVGSIADITNLAGKIQKKLAEPYSFDGQQFYAPVSLGIALHPDDSDGATELLKNAAIALQKAKKTRNCFAFFTRDLDQQAKRQISLEKDLRSALESHELQLVYQPQFETNSCRLTGVEALIRWRHPLRGMIMPDQFIPLAEKTGLIIPIGQWVINVACLQARHWQRSGWHDPRVAINLSAKQVHDPRLVSHIQAALDKAQINPACITLEITETSIMENIDQAIALFRELKTLGVKLSIDDFGTGYSSLNFLKKFPIDQIKIDRTFIADIARQEDDQAIVEALITMAHRLKLSVLAEGIETVAQFNLLKKLKCDELQGYLLSRPISFDEFNFTRDHCTGVAGGPASMVAR